MQVYWYTVDLRGILLAIAGESEQIAHLTMDRRESMKGNCIDCGDEYQLDALNLDLRCAACVEQWVVDELEGAKV